MEFFCDHIGQQRGFPSVKYFILGCVGSGLDLDLWRGGRGRLGIWKSLHFAPMGIEVEKLAFRTVWDITGQRFQGLGLTLKAVVLTFRDLDYHLCQTFMRVAGCGIQNV